jgi:glycosyltransferase involved in cell wall biosynthesis
MKILLVSLFLPQRRAYHAGGRYAFEVLKNISTRHEVYLATRIEANEISCLKDLNPFCKKIYTYPYRSNEKRGLRETLRLIINYLGFSLYANRLVRRGSYDIVHVDWVEAALMIKKRNTPMVLMAYDVITKPAERFMKKGKGLRKFLGLLRYLFVKKMETTIVRKFSAVLTFSEFDRNYLLSMKPGLTVRVVPYPAGLDITGKKVTRLKNTILFLASYKYRKVNVDAALYFYRSIFSRIRVSIPNARFIIAGYGPPDELTELQNNDPQVVVPGFVEDTEEYYKKAAVFVAPILVGGGIIVKILDALAAGTAVVTTSYGNEGIRAVHGKDLLVADDPASFANAVIEILEDEKLARCLSENGCAFVEQNYNLRRTMTEIESAYKEVV